MKKILAEIKALEIKLGYTLQKADKSALDLAIKTATRHNDHKVLATLKAIKKAGTASAQEMELITTWAAKPMPF